MLRADFREDFHSIPGGYDLQLDKQQQLRKAPPSVVNNVTISHSTDFQVGDHNVQNIQQAFLSLAKAIESQNAAPESKADAKSKLKALLEHPLVIAVLGGFAGGIGG